MAPPPRKVLRYLLPLLVSVVLLVPPLPPGGATSPHRVATVQIASGPGPEYVNLTDNASNWTSDFYDVTWPSGTYSAVELTVLLANYGDPWDRADWIDLNNVTLVDLTTLENSSGNNPVQRYSSNVTEYEALFAGPGHVWWQAMPNWIAGCDTTARGCWSGVLSFAFLPGSAPPGLPKVVPVLPFDTLTTSAPSVNGTLRVSGTFAHAEAVVFQEGQSNDEFWYLQPFSARELLWQWDNQTVLAMLPLPFINSGGALGGIDDLAEWNGTPAPGTGPRPAVTSDLTPWLGMLNASPWYNFTVVDNGNYWQVGLALFLWTSSDLREVAAENATVVRSLGAHTASVQGRAFALFSEPFATELYDVNWSQYLNASGTVIDVATAAESVDRVVSATVTIVRVDLCRTVFDVRVDSSGAVHTLVLANWTNTTTVAGNGQGGDLTQQGSVAWMIDGSSAGLASTERRLGNATSTGNYTAPIAQFAGGTAWFQNRSSSHGVGTSAPSVSLSWGGPAVPLPGWFVIAPTANDAVRGSVRAAVVAAPGSAGGANISLGNRTWAVPPNDSVVVDLSALRNGTYQLNLTGPTIAGFGQLSLPIRVTGWMPPYVAPLMAAASATPSVGEAPFTPVFSASAQGGMLPYLGTWWFGDGSSTAGTNATHTYSGVGFYQAWWNVTDARNRTSSTSVGVQVLARLAVALVSFSSSWTVGATTTLDAQVTGGLGPMNTSWGAAPPGCEAAQESRLTCTPTQTGPISIEVLVTDPLGYTSAGWFNTTVGGSGASPNLANETLLLGGGLVGALAVAGLFWVARRRGRSS